jgi:CRP-like cAMP-binding protein
MIEDGAAVTYRVWGADKVVYGPVELPVLVAWAKEERILPDTWVLVESRDEWVRARNVAELKTVLKTPSRSPRDGRTGETQITCIEPGALRRIKLLADLDSAQLESFLRYLEIQRFRQYSRVVTMGDHGDAMFLVVEGELRVRLVIDGKETILTNITVGEFFGEISILDEGPRSADVIANVDAVLLKISAINFHRMIQEAPALAAPFLAALSRSISGRIRTLTRKYQDSIHLSRTATGIDPSQTT